eukprot:GHVN01035357.1.p1 GENE.GHVN01035357.1~~GHVN01035357.1.p1  ORF type:complete len:435 (+),score=37.21 GHVN01035357.1:42-1346(+)
MKESRLVLPRAVLASYLSRHSTGPPAFYPIEYATYRSNHMSHALIALAYLGADVPRLDRFVKWYTNRLGVEHVAQARAEAAKLAFKPSKQPECVASLIGLGQDYHTLRNYYSDLLVNRYHNDLCLAVRELFPSLARAIPCAAFHGLIQTGYALAEAHPGLVAEGLAYMHFSYIPLNTTQRKLRLNINGMVTDSRFSVINALSNAVRDEALQGLATDVEVRANVKAQHPGMGAFQPMVKHLFQHHGDVLYQYVKRIWVPLHSGNQLEAVEELFEWLILTACSLLCRCERQNDFFLLHAATSAWALRQVARCLAYPAADGGATIPDEIQESTAVFLCAVVATYISQGAPVIRPIEESLSSVEDHDWDRLIKELIVKDEEEHVFKLVSQCYEMYASIKNKPNCTERQEDLAVLWQCASNVVSSPLFFHVDSVHLKGT